MAASPLVTTLLEDLAESHRLLLQQPGAEDPAAADGLEAVLGATLAATAGLSEAALSWQPQADQWSMAEVIEHMVEHDRHYLELERHGIGHYVEHGLEHALQLWSLRRGPAPDSTGGTGSNPSSATLE